MKLAQDITKADLEEMGFTVQEITSTPSRVPSWALCQKGLVRVSLAGPDGIDLCVFESKVDGPTLWYSTFTGTTPAAIVLASVRLALSILVVQGALPQGGA